MSVIALVLRACLLTALLCMTCAASDAAAGGESVSFQSTTASYNGKTFTVEWVEADLTDPRLRVMPVTAEDCIGHVESFAGMMERSNAVAGVNGTFFDAYEEDDSKRYPAGC